MAKRSVIGVIVPGTDEVVHRMFHGKTIWAAPWTEEVSSLMEGDRAFFADEASRTLEGEASVLKISRGPGEHPLSQEKRFFMSDEEFSQYLGRLGVGRESELLILRFQGAVKYSAPLRLGFAVPPTGKVMTRDMFDEILRSNRRPP